MLIRRLMLVPTLLLAVASSPGHHEQPMIGGVVVAVTPTQVTMVTKIGSGTLDLPRDVEVFVAERVPIDQAQPGDTVAATGVKVKDAATPTLESGELYLVRDPVPASARRALALRFLSPSPAKDPLNIGFATWSGIVLRAGKDDIEIRRDDGSPATVRPNADEFVSRLRPGTRAELAGARVSLFGVSDTVTAIVVDQRPSPEPQVLHLTAPRNMAGPTYPAGSTLTLNKDGSVDQGTVPVPTRIAGLLLIGDFQLVRAGVDGFLSATAEVDGVPCSAGKVSWNGDWGRDWPRHVACTLARATAVDGHDLAAGTPVAVSARASGDRLLDAGTLSHSELLFGVSWPAGTILHGTAATPDRLAHAPTSPGEEVTLCTPAGQDVAIPGGVVIHGKVGFAVRESRRTLEYCTESDRPDDADGYLTAGAARHSRGDQAALGSPWRWNDYRATP